MNTNNFLVGLAVAGALPFAIHASPALDLAKQLNQAFIEVAEKVSPSVVVINVVEKPAVAETNDDGAWSNLPREFRRYFHQQFDSPPPEKQHGQGSGVIIRKDGYILTNRHVVDNAEKIEVRLKDGRHFAATVQGEDSQSDVAVIKIDAKNLPTAAFADSAQTHVGEFAIAIGAPYDLDYSVTFGHISAKGRNGVVYDPSMDQDFIQTDANINPGNSGGPLVNIDGQVIGINTLIHGLHTGIGFAVPSNLAREVADQLIANGRFTRAWLGVGIKGLHEDSEFSDLITGVDTGVIVRSIVPDGPAAKSDLKPADIITAVDGKSVSTAQELKNEIRRKAIGMPVTLSVFRHGKSIQLAVRPGEWEEKKEAAEVRPAMVKPDESSSLGLTVQRLTPQIVRELQTTVAKGVVVTDVERGSLAARKGIKPGDIITEVNQQPVFSAKDFRLAVQDADLKRGVILNFTSGKTSRFEVLKNDDE